MKFRKFKQNRLWRDKLVDIRQGEGSKIHWSRLDDAAFARELKTKFAEEAQEVIEAQNTQELIEELGDVLEIIEMLCTAHGITQEKVVTMQKAKRERFGGFAGRKYVTLAKHPVGSFSEEYCLARPKKNPEIIE